MRLRGSARSLSRSCPAAAVSVQCPNPSETGLLIEAFLLRLARMHEPTDWDARARDMASELEAAGFDEHGIRAIVDARLRDDMAEASGADPIAMEALGLIRQLGSHRRALRHLNDPDWQRVLTTKAQRERNERLIEYVELSRAQLPGWRRLLG